MNKIEKIVYDLVKKNPRLKTRLRNIYQTIYDILPDKKDYFLNDVIVQDNYFFGFHDCDPFSLNSNYVLANKLNIPLRMPEKDDLLTVGFFQNNFSDYVEIAKTQAWNYHKGCRLQWLGNNDDKIIFNNIINEKLGANIFSLYTKQLTAINYAVDTVSPNGKYATNFSYERLNRYMPGYGYNVEDEAFFEEKDSENTGLFLIDINNNTRKLIVPLNRLAHIEEEETMKNANHYVTHTEFSPDGARIAFLHRWTFDDPEKRFTRLVTCKLDGSDINVSNTTGMVSHYDWDKEHGIIAYCQVNGIDGHYLFKDGNLKNPTLVTGKVNSDGHQSYIPKTDYFITDTYPDKRRYAKLYAINIKNGDIKLIADVKSPKQFQSPDTYKHWACDLHPRVSRNGKYLCFDSVHTGKRALCVMMIDSIKLDN